MKLKVNLARSEMMAFKRSINYVLATRSVKESPTLSQVFPEAPSLLVAIDSFIATLDYYHPFAQARRDVIQYERSHQDMEGLKEALGVSDEWMDQVFLDAMRFEGIR